MPVVAPFGALVVALAAALIIFAIYTLFRPLLTSLAANIPIIGSTLAQVIDGVIGWAWFWAKAGAETALADLVGLLTTPLHWIATLFDNLAGGLSDTYIVLSYLRYAVFPRLISEALQVASGWIGDVQRYATGLYNQAIGYTNAEVGALRNWTVAEVNALTRFATTLYNQAIAFTTAGLGNLTRYATGLYQQAIGFAAAGDAALQHYASTLFTQAINYTGIRVTDLENWTKASLASLQSWTGSEVLSLEHQIALAQTQAFAFARAEAGTVEADLTRLKTECTDNLCENLSPLANLFNALTSLIDDAAIVAMAAEFAHDPAGAARDMQAEFGGFVDDAVHGLRDAVGV